MAIDSPKSVELGEWKLLPERVALHLPTGTLIAADLHVGYGRERTLRGDAVPIPSLEDELGSLLAAWSREKPNRLVIAGDLVEKARPDLLSALAEWFSRSGIRLEGLVRGNHDGGKSRWPLPLLPEGFLVGRHAICHEYPGTPGPVVHGHEHPAVALPGLGLVPCFLLDERRLVLAAYSQDATGGNILRRKDIDELREMQCLAVAGTRVENLGTVLELEAHLGAPRRTRNKR